MPLLRGVIEWPNTLVRPIAQRRGADGRHCTAPHRHTNPCPSSAFTYQRFADYRVVAALLKPLNGDPTRLRDALGVGKPLRKRVLKAPVQLDRGPCRAAPRAVRHRAMGRCSVAASNHPYAPSGIKRLCRALQRGGLPPSRTGPASCSRRYSTGQGICVSLHSRHC